MPTVLRASLLAFALTLVACGSWHERDAYEHCEPALRGSPWAPTWTCDGVMLCANEAPLSAAEQARVASIGRRLGCPP